MNIHCYQLTFWKNHVTHVLESDNEQTLKLIQQLAEQLNIHCQFILQKTKAAPTKQDEINNAIEFVKTFSQEKTSLGDALIWQKTERQERPLDY